MQSFYLTKTKPNIFSQKIYVWFVEATKKRRFASSFLAPRVSITQGRAYLLVKPQKKEDLHPLLAPRVGFEPTAYRLTVECSTAELSGNICSLRDIKITQVNVLYNMFFSFASVFMKFLNLCLLDFFYLSYSSLK